MEKFTDRDGLREVDRIVAISFRDFIFILYLCTEGSVSPWRGDTSIESTCICTSRPSSPMAVEICIYMYLIMRSLYSYSWSVVYMIISLYIFSREHIDEYVCLCCCYSVDSLREWWSQLLITLSLIDTSIDISSCQKYLYVSCPLDVIASVFYLPYLSVVIVISGSRNVYLILTSSPWEMVAYISCHHSLSLLSWERSIDVSRIC